MPRGVKTGPRTRRTKEEVQAAFSEIRKEVASARAATDAKSEQLDHQKEAEAREAVAGLSVEAVVESIATLGIGVNKALAQLSEKLVQEVERLAAVRQAVELERREMERLHRLDIAATALDQLVQEYEQRKRALETEIAEGRSAWDEESRATERDRKEQEDAVRKQRTREAEEYEYKKTMERKKAQDKYDEDLKLQERKNKEKQEELEKSWKQRETTLKGQEEELLRLRKEAQDLPARLQKEAEQAASQAARAAEARAEQEVLLLRKEAEAEKRLSELQVRTLEEAIARQGTQIAGLQKQLEEAKAQVQEIAVKAIDGASGSRALAHVNQIAMEQAKTRSPQG